MHVRAAPALQPCGQGRGHWRDSAGASGQLLRRKLPAAKVHQRRAARHPDEARIAVMSSAPCRPWVLGKNQRAAKGNITHRSGPLAHRRRSSMTTSTFSSACVRDSRRSDRDPVCRRTTGHNIYGSSGNLCSVRSDDGAGRSCRCSIHRQPARSASRTLWCVSR
jgi:hypothetical protein